MRALLRDLGVSTKPVPMFSDSQGSLAVVRSGKVSARTKHIEVQHHFVAECESLGKVKFEYLPTERMIADALTKPLAKEKFELFREAMGVR